MKGKVTSKKLNDSINWFDIINTNEKKLKYIVEKDVNYVYLTFYLRSEKIYSQFKQMLKNKAKRLISDGWSLGESKMSHTNKDISIFLIILINLLVFNLSAETYNILALPLFIF